MKKIILIFTVAITAIAFLSIPTACSTEAPLAPENERTISVESRDAAAKQFIRQYKIQLQRAVNGGSIFPNDFTVRMKSERDMEFDTTIWYELELTYNDGTTEIVNVIPTIYKGTSTSSFITVPTTRYVSSFRMIDATILQPTEW